MPPGDQSWGREARPIGPTRGRGRGQLSRGPTPADHEGRQGVPYMSSRRQKIKAVQAVLADSRKCAEIRHLYWDCGERADEIERAYGLPRATAAQIAGPVETNIPCQICGRTLFATSRCGKNNIEIDFRRMPVDSPLLYCGACKKIYRARKKIEFDLITRRRAFEVKRLRSIPYNEYLRTDHWRRVREMALSIAHGRCQVCNSDRHLQVHHRSYKNRGYEEPFDVIVLCDGCHSLFHKERRLASA